MGGGDRGDAGQGFLRKGSHAGAVATEATTVPFRSSVPGRQPRATPRTDQGPDGPVGAEPMRVSTERSTTAAPSRVTV